MHKLGYFEGILSIQMVLSDDEVSRLIYSIGNILESEFPESSHHSKCRYDDRIEPAWHTDI
jgi:hypothetical protein